MTEPTLKEFFAIEAGVCVYVNVGGYAIRVSFESLEALGSVAEALPGAERARAAAKAVLEQHRAELGPLFKKVANREPGNARD